MKYNNNTRNNSLLVKLFSSLLVFVFAVASVFALPSITSTNLQTTAGVTVTGTAGVLTVTAPDKAVLTWQTFGSGTDTIGLTDVLNYGLPNKNASVLNVVSGGASTTIDGSIVSNGNVYVLNPNGIIIGNGARIDANKFYAGTSDNTSFAAYYFAQNGKLPSQDGLATLAGTTSVSAGAIIRVTENITIASKNVTIGGAFIQGNAVLVADGNVAVGTTGLTYVDGDLSLTNQTGATVLGSTGNNLIITGNLNSTGGTISGFNTVGTAGTIQAKTATISGGVVLADKINTNTLTVTGTNVTANVGSATTNPVVNITASGTVSVTAPATLTANITNTGNNTTTVSSLGALTLGNIQVEGTGATSFTGTSVTDTASRIFVYGPASFTATSGNVTVNKGAHSFGPLSVAATGESVVVEDAATQLNVVNTPKFTLRSADYVFQAPTTGVVTSPLVSVTGTGNVNLGTVTNSAGAYTVAGKDVTVSNNGALSLTSTTTGNLNVASTGAVTLGETSAAGTLTVASAGAISQAADTKIRSFGTTTFAGTSLTLSNTGNEFGNLAIDVGAAGTVSLNEETILNLTGLRAATVTLRGTSGVITTGTSTVGADTFNIITGGDFVPAANFRAVNTITVLSSGNVDLSALSSTTNLNSKSPSVIAKGYKAPQP